MATAVLHHAAATAQTLMGSAARPMAASTTGTGNTNSSSDTGSSSATISSNDFLTLLVTEMQNQDPTANMDPNEYINQLVQVNSLEQLIDINQTLGTALNGTTSSASVTNPQVTPVIGSGGDAQQSNAVSAAHALTHATGALPVSGPGTGGGAAAEVSSAAHAQGNLSVPRANASAERVGHALDGRTHARSIAGRSFANR